jgi:RNA polymerase sigma-70 factor, ECF subfamily
MQAIQSQIEDGPNAAAEIRQRNMEELQDAISRQLPLFHRRAYRYLGNTHDAEDAVQDALLSAYKHLDQFKGSAKMTTWLTSIVTNSALTKLRKRRRHPHSSLDEPLAHDPKSCESDRLVDVRLSPEDECAMTESHRHLMQALDKLSSTSRTIIQMRVFDGLTTSETALILGLPESTIKSRVLRARLQLKRHATLDLKRTVLPARMHGPTRPRRVNGYEPDHHRTFSERANVSPSWLS